MSVGADDTFKFRGDFSDVRSGLNSLKGQFLSFGQQIAATGIGQIISNVFTKALDTAKQALRAIIAEVSEWVKVAAEAELISVRLGIAVANAGPKFDFSAKQLESMADGLRDISMFGDEAVQQAQTLLIRFNLTGETFKRTTELAVDMASAMGRDVAGSAQLLGVALQNPQRGMMMLQRQGIALTAAQKDLIKEFLRVGDIAKAQGVILDSLEAKLRGSAEIIAGTAVGSWAQLKEAIGDAKEALGNLFLPVLAQLIPILTENIQRLRDWAKQFEVLAKVIGVGLRQPIQNLKDDILALSVTFEVAIDRMVKAISKDSLKRKVIEFGISIKQALGEVHYKFKESAASDQRILDALDKLNPPEAPLSFKDEVATRMLGELRERRDRRPPPRAPAAPEDIRNPNAGVVPTGGPLGFGGPFLLDPFSAFELLGRGLAKPTGGEHKSAIEDASSLFRRIQVAAASDPDNTDNKQLTVLEQIEVHNKLQLEKQEATNVALRALLTKQDPGLG